jgi:hypothetical protein
MNTFRNARAGKMGYGDELAVNGVKKVP